MRPAPAPSGRSRSDCGSAGAMPSRSHSRQPHGPDGNSVHGPGITRPKSSARMTCQFGQERVVDVEDDGRLRWRRAPPPRGVRSRRGISVPGRRSRRRSRSSRSRPELRRRRRSSARRIRAARTVGAAVAGWARLGMGCRCGRSGPTGPHPASTSASKGGGGKQVGRPHAGQRTVGLGAEAPTN